MYILTIYATFILILEGVELCVCMGCVEVLRNIDVLELNFKRSAIRMLQLDSLLPDC